MDRIITFLLVAGALASNPIQHRRAAFSAGGSWANSNYSHYIAVTLPSSEVSSTETDIVASIDLDDMPDHFFANMQTDADDIRVYADDDATALAFDIENVDTTAKTGWMHVHIATLSSTVDTIIHVYYDYPSATAYATPEDTWDATGANYMAVWKMNDTATGPQSSATGVAAIEADSFNMESGDLVAGKMGNCIDFDGVNEYFSVPIADATSNLRPDTSFTAGCWFQADDFTDGVIFQGSGSSTNQGYGIWIWSSQLRPSGGGSGNPWTNLTEPTSGLSTGTWYHAVMTWDNSNFRFYLNGSEITDSPYSHTGSWSWASQPFFLGRRESSGYYHGKIDHAFVHDDAFTSNRIGILYEFQNSTFAYTVGTVQNKP